jgi:hypothetical protein
MTTLPTNRVFLFVLFLGLFTMTARNVTDPDVWWHLKTGEYIALHHSIPHTDPFSYTRAGQPWVAHEWLTELFLYQLQRITGFAGLILVFAAILCASFFLLYLRCGPSPYIAGIATLCGAWATAPLWGVRPQVVSLLLTSLWLLILEHADRRPSLLWWTVPLMLFWVNLHAGFALGLALSLLFLLGGIIEHRLGYATRNPPFRIQAFILLLDFLVVPVNPNGLRLFSYPIDTLRSQAMQNYIAEWASPNFHSAEYWPFLLILLALFAILSWSRLRLRPRELILLLVGLYSSLASIRLIPLFVLVAVPIIARRLGSWPNRSHEPAFSLLHPIFNAAIILAMAAFAAVQVTKVIQRQPSAENQHFPTGAAAFLRTHPPAGPIFNHYDWGGYLIWKLYPTTRVFIDGRADVYGPDLLHEFADAYQLKGPWRQVLQRWSVRTVVIPPDSALAAGLLAASPPWINAYRDAHSVILTAPP